MRSRFDAVADDQSQVSDSSTIKTTDSANLDAKNNKMSLPSSAKKTMSEEQKKKLEKGWTLHSRKNYSYNMKIQENIVKSSSKLKDSWTTDHTKKRLKVQHHKEALAIAKKIGLENLPKSPLGGAKALLMERHHVDASEKAKIRHGGSYKSNQYYPGSKMAEMALAKHTHEMIKTPEGAFEQFKLRLYTRTSLWLQKRGMTRAVPASCV